jgi:hypothetical protein
MLNKINQAQNRPNITYFHSFVKSRLKMMLMIIKMGNEYMWETLDILFLHIPYIVIFEVITLIHSKSMYCEYTVSS